MNTKRNRAAQKKFSFASLKKFKEFIHRKGKCLYDGVAATPRVVIKNYRYTCETGFQNQKERPVTEMWRLLGLIKGSRLNITSPVQAYMKQRSNDFDLIFYVKPKNHRIKSYFRMPSMIPIGRVRNLGPMISLPWKYMTSVLWSRWTWAEVNRPHALQTCCRKKLHIYFRANLCQKNSKICFWVSTKFTLKSIYCS